MSVPVVVSAVVANSTIPLLDVDASSPDISPLLISIPSPAENLPLTSDVLNCVLVSVEAIVTAPPDSVIVTFEPAVNAKVSEIEEKLEAENADRIKELEEKFSKYTDYATEEWLKENALEIKYSLRTEIAENFIKDLKGLFEKNYIDIPEDDIKVVDELTEAVEGYKDQMSEKDELVEKLQEKVLAFERADITTEVSEGLTETQKIRLEKLGESVEAGLSLIHI